MAGRAALTLAAVEIPAGVASIAADSPWPIVAGSLLSAVATGETVFDLYNNRNHPANNLGRLTRWLAKEDPPDQK